jgi:hypothetical protein
MPEGENDRQRRLHRSAKYLWAGLAGVAIVIGALAGIFTIRNATSSHGLPSLEADLSTLAGAREFNAFLASNDGQVVYLKVECDQYVLPSHSKHLRPGDRCLAQDVHDYSASSPRASQLITFEGKKDAQEGWNGPYTPASASKEAWTWIPYHGEVDATLTNGKHGVGYQLVKGYYEVILEAGGIGPPEAQIAELLAMPPPT